MMTVVLLVCSNLFMTFAWYWHLKGGREGSSWPLWGIILASWLIALPEYCLAVTANRLGSAGLGGSFSTAQLKIIQEAISITVFLAFLQFYLKEWPTWREFAGLLLILAGVALAVSGRKW